MLRNMTNSLLRHEVIKTTLPKAKELRRVVEPIITLGKKLVPRLPCLAHYRFHGEFIGVRSARKHVGWYLDALTGGSPDDSTRALRRAINQSEQADEQVRLLERYFADRAPMLDTGIDQGGTPT